MIRTKSIILSTFLLLILPAFAYATEFAVEVDVGKEVVNALEGKINVPSHLSIERIYTAESAVLIWIEEPLYDSNSHTISFSGITPGGFRGKKTTFIFQGHFDEADLAGFSFSDVRVLKNDGSGTVAPARFSIKKTELLADQESPNEFSITISSSPEIFEGRRFITFLTQDKGSGVKGYEYSSTWFLSPRDASWRPVGSPIALTLKESFQRIHVRAVDNADNVRVSSTAGPYWYMTLLLGVIIILCVLLLIRRLFSSSRPSSS